MILYHYANLFAQTFLSTCLLIVLLPIFLPLLIFTYIWAFLIQLLVKLKHGHSATRICGTDAIFRADTNKKTAILNVVIRFTGEMDVNKFRSRFLKLVGPSAHGTEKKHYKRLTQVIFNEFGYSFRKDTKSFNIDNHLQVVLLKDLIKLTIEKELKQTSLAANAEHIEELRKYYDKDKEDDPDWMITTKCLLSEFGRKRIDPNLPQWQLIFVKESSDRYTTMIRFHHSTSDGVYLARFISEEFLDTSPNDLYKYSMDRPSKAERFFGFVWGILLLPITVGKMIAEKNVENPLHGPKLSEKKKYYISNPISLESLRDIRKRTNSNINGIIFSCTSAAFALHFKRRSNVQEFVTVRFPIPLQNLMKPVVLTNKFAFVTLKVPTPLPLGASFPPNLDDGHDTSLKLVTCSSLDRLLKIKSLFEDAKKDPTHMSVYYLVQILCNILPNDVIDFLLASNHVTMGFSNIPGPRTPIVFDNSVVENLMFWFPTFEPMNGVSMSIQSYNGKFKVGLVLDEVLLKEEIEGDLILQDFENEIKNILQELDNPPQNATKIVIGDILPNIP